MYVGVQSQMCETVAKFGDLSASVKSIEGQRLNKPSIGAALDEKSS